jgi:hypothetical protein
MVDLHEIDALKASIRGARHSNDALAALAARIDALDPHTDVSEADLDDLHRVSLAHALASQALRGFVETMQKRRGRLAEVAIDSGAGNAPDEE